jgi:hypothetical protein
MSATRGRPLLWILLAVTAGLIAAAGVSQGNLAVVSVRAGLTAVRGPQTTLWVAPAARTPTPRPLKGRRSSGAAIVYLLVLLAFFGLFLFTRNRLRRT